MSPPRIRVKAFLTLFRKEGAFSFVNLHCFSFVAFMALLVMEEHSILTMSVFDLLKLLYTP
jgi:hypothetical protein